MIQRREYINYYWEPYMLSENEFLSIVDYVALRDCNLNTSSEKLIRCLLSTCELFESTMKAMYDLSGKSSFDEYLKKMMSDTSFNMDVRMHLRRGMLTTSFQPFVEAKPGNAPLWWSAHNKVKHDRTTAFDAGNLQNCILALAALYYANCQFVKKIGDYWYTQLPHTHSNCRDVPNDTSKLFASNFLKTRHSVMAYEVYAVTNDEIDDIFKL